MPGLSGIYIYMMLSSAFDLGVHIVALAIGLVMGLLRWPWWLPIVISVVAILLTQKGGDLNFWLLGFPFSIVAVYVVYALGRLFVRSRPASTGN